MDWWVILLIALGGFFGAILALSIIWKIYRKFNIIIYNSDVSLKGKTVIITGANQGMGYEITKALAKRDARIIMACRNIEKAVDVRNKIISETGNGNIEVKNLDLGSLESTKRFAEDMNRTEKNINILIHNAGVFDMTDTKSVESYERHLMVNHLGPFLLTCLLTDKMKASAPGRIINVSSGFLAYKATKIDAEMATLIGPPKEAYPRSKIYFHLAMNHLARKLKHNGITVNSLYPGLVRNKNNQFPFLLRTIKSLVSWWCKSSFEGAQTAIFLAVSPSVELLTGEFFANCTKVDKTPEITQDEKIGQKVWELSEERVGLKQRDEVSATSM